MNKYYLELPENYKLDKTIDMKKMSTNIFLNVLNILFVIISFLNRIINCYVYCFDWIYYLYSST